MHHSHENILEYCLVEHKIGLILPKHNKNGNKGQIKETYAVNRIVPNISVVFWFTIIYEKIPIENQYRVALL